MATLYDFIFTLFNCSSKAWKNFGISIFIFSSFSPLIGTLNIISSDNISYSILLANEVTKLTIVSLSASSSFVTFKLINFPYFSIKKRGEPIHFI